MFHWDDHYIRLVQSCLGARIPLGDIEFAPSNILKAAVQEKLSFHPYKESLVKILVTRGKSRNHSTPIAGTSSLLIDILPLRKISPRPLKLEIQNGVREFPRVKLAGGYGYTMIRGEIAARHGCDDFFFSSPETGVTESSVGNIFFIFNGEYGPILYTPGDGILKGITRQIVLELAIKSKRFYRVEDMMPLCYASDVSCYAGNGECFITSTTRGIHPVGTIVDLNGVTHQFSVGQKTVTEELKRLFLNYREAYFAKHGA